MRTNIDIKEELIQEAMELAEISTKKEIVELALTEFVQQRKRKNLADLRGKIFLADDYDYKKARGSM
jgi:Arc/MetJ family transcription regulator